MTDAPSDAAAGSLAAARAALAAARDRLTASGARDEILARIVHRRLRGDTFVEVERVWRLGVLLLGRSGTLYATGTTFRIDEERVDNHQSNLASARRRYREIALRAGFAPGETITIDAEPVDWDAGGGTDAGPAALMGATGPVILTPDGLFVRWSTSTAALTPFASYLAERVELLADPPQGT